MMSYQNILVIGATGKVGSEVVSLLAKNNSVSVFAGIRNMSRAPEFEAKGVNAVHLDLDDVTTLPGALHNIDSMLLLSGYSVDMLKQSKRVIDAAKTAGVKHIVHIGASSNDTAEVAHWGWHKMIEAYIEQQGFNFTHIQPEAFMQNMTAFGWLSKHGVTNLIKNAVWSWVDAHDVAAIAAEALARPNDFKNQVWKLGYHAATIHDVAGAIGAEVGKELSVIDADPHDFYAQAIASGADAAYMACIRDQFVLNGEGRIANADATFDKEAFKQATGRYPTTWSDFIARESDALKNAVA